MIKVGDDHAAIILNPAAEAVDVRVSLADGTFEARIAETYSACPAETKDYIADIDRRLLASLPIDGQEIGYQHIAMMPDRLKTSLNYTISRMKIMARLLVASREVTNFTYNVTGRNLRHLSHVVSAVANIPQSLAYSYLCEPAADAQLIGHLHRMSISSPLRIIGDDTPTFGRRLGWYALVRARKPKVVVETGVDKGLGSVLLCAALRRNGTEGYPGTYCGTDINPSAGHLLSGPYAEVGRIIYGDSIETLGRFQDEIDIFINDSDHSAEYERREYEQIKGRLTKGAIVLGDNSHSNDTLMTFSEENGRQFLFFREEPEEHWYPGCGIGISY